MRCTKTVTFILQITARGTKKMKYSRYVFTSFWVMFIIRNTAQYYGYSSLPIVKVWRNVVGCKVRMCVGRENDQNISTPNISQF